MHRPAAPAVPIARWSDGSWVHAADQVAAEEPLQLLLNGEPLSVLMRTPGSDLELALGLLLAERVITGLNDVARVHLSAESAESESALPVTSDLLELNQVDVRLRGAAGRRPHHRAHGAREVEARPITPAVGLDDEPAARLGVEAARGHAGLHGVVREAHGVGEHRCPGVQLTHAPFQARSVPPVFPHEINARRAMDVSTRQRPASDP